MRMEPLKILFAITIIVLFSSASLLLAKEKKDDVWVAEEIDGVGVVASVNGRIVHGDRYRIRVGGNNCEGGSIFFTFLTIKNSKNIPDLTGKVVEIKHNQKVIDAEIIIPEKTPIGHIVIFQLGFETIESIVSSHKDENKIIVELIDNERFKASDYFDVLKNEWSLDNLESSLIQAQKICRNSKKDKSELDNKKQYLLDLPLAEQGDVEAQNNIAWMFAQGKGVPKDYSEAVKWWKLAAEQGNSDAQYNLGVLFSNGQGISQDYKEATKWYRLAADQGNAKAQFNLGILYGNGQGVEQDYKEAVRLYRLAAEQGIAEAQYNLGVMYEEGQGFQKDNKEAVKWYGLAAEQGFVDAQFNLGTMYESGQGVEQDYKESAKWLKLAAEQGNAEAQFSLGWIYKEGNGVPQNYTEAVKWFRLSANQGNATAQHRLGSMYDNGQGVPKDFKEAFKWWKLAADQEISGAQFELGVLYAMGRGTLKDNEEAFKWWKLAAEQGHEQAQINLNMLEKNRAYNIDSKNNRSKEDLNSLPDTLDEVLNPKAMEMFNAFLEKDSKKLYEMNLPLAQSGDQFAQWNLGNYYLRGEGVEQDYKQAFKWYSLSAKQGHKRAQFDLGVMYDNGEGIPKNHEEAFKWFLLSAEQGFSSAQRILGVMYENGRGVEQNHKEAVKWHKLAADKGHADSQNFLGQMYEIGQDVPRDYKEAIKWYKLAAEQNDIFSQNNLGVIYYQGKGVPKDDEEALKWFSLAAEQGNERAQVNLDLLKKELDNKNSSNAKEPSEITTEFNKLLQLAEQGDAKAQNKLANMFRKGRGVSQDYKEAVKWYQLSAKQEYAKAQANLGTMYDKGLGISQDYKEAVKLWKAAADKGNGIAQFNLGTMYSKGNGVSQDYKEAFKWFTLAAEQALVKAQSRLGKMYSKGHGVPKDYTFTHMWFNIAGSNGDNEAIEHRTMLEKEMTPSQIEKAQDMAREWVERHRGRSIESSSKKNTTYLFVCNNAEYYDKASKKGPTEVMASASVTIQTDQKKAELLLGSKTNSLLNTRANHDMDLAVELTDGEYIFTGTEDTGNPETDTYFSYFTKKKELLASYSDVVIKFNECVDMGSAGAPEELSKLSPYQQKSVSNHIKHFQHCGIGEEDIEIIMESGSKSVDIIAYSIRSKSPDLECLISPTKTKSDVPPKNVKLAEAADKGDPIIYSSLFDKSFGGDGPDYPTPEGLIKLNDTVLIFTGPDYEHGIKRINKISSRYIIVASAMSTHTRNYLVSMDSKEIRHLTDGFKVEVVDKEKLIFKATGRKSYFKDFGGPFWYDALIDKTGKLIDIVSVEDKKNPECYSRSEFFEKSDIETPDGSSLMGSITSKEICVER
jgi:TPR repeat protein